MMMVTDLMLGLLLGIFLLVPLSLKWELDKTVTFPAIGIIGVLTGLVVSPVAASLGLPGWGRIGLLACCIVAVAGALLMWRFFRDPDRHCAANGRVIYSAADGQVIYVKEIKEGAVPVSEKKGRSFTLHEFTGTEAMASSGYLIGTAMTYLDVHVNRAPVAGTIRLLNHIPGRFLSLKNPDAVFQNERVATLVKGDEIAIGVVQIASRLVRNIIPFVGNGDQVKQGQRIGKIRFGSQVDLVVPDSPDLRVLVKPGDKVKAGLTIMARY